jgi:hypothetical protein
MALSEAEDCETAKRNEDVNHRDVSYAWQNGNGGIYCQFLAAGDEGGVKRASMCPAFVAQLCLAVAFLKYCFIGGIL